MLTDEQGNFKFPNVKPGRYQLRAHVIGGKKWFDAGRILYASADASDAERTPLQSLDFKLAPFKKGHWTTWTSRDGLPSNHIRKFWLDPDGLLWIATGVSLPTCASSQPPIEIWKRLFAMENFAKIYFTA